MNVRLRSGLIGGVFGLLITLASGGQVAYLGGIIAGMIAGLLTSQAETETSPAAGARQGLQAGLVAGVLVVIGQLIRGLTISPLIDASAPLQGSVLTTALGGFVVAAIVAALFAAVRTLPAPRDTYANFGLIGLLILAYPWIDQGLQLDFMNEVIPVLIYILMALGLNIVVGYAGLLDLGYAAFFAIGAYTTGMLASPHFDIEMSWWLAVWFAVAVAAIFGVILGAPTLPLRGDYLAIVTLGFGEIVPITIRNLDSATLWIFNIPIFQDVDITGGTKGINPIHRPELPFIGEFTPADPFPWYYLIIVMILVSAFFIIRLRNSRIGRSWAAMREDELAAESMGINLVRTKLLAFAMGATFSGFAGAFYAAYISAIFPESFRFDVSVMLLCMVILGGLGNMVGVVLGGLIIQFADRLFLPQMAGTIQKLSQQSGIEWMQEVNFASDFRLILFGLTLVIMMLVRPEGLVPGARARKAKAEPTTAGGA